jgi:hypothetical protein
MGDHEYPIRRSRAKDLTCGVWYFGAGHIACRLIDITYDQLSSVFGSPHVEKVPGTARRFFWSLWDDKEQVRLVIASDSPDEKRAVRWKVGAINRKERDVVRRIVGELFAAENIVNELSAPRSRRKRRA